MKTLPLIHKRTGVYVSAPCNETTIIRAPNGQMVTLTFAYYQQQARVVVRDFASGAQIASANWPAANTGGGTAIVSDGVLYVFAAAPFVGSANQIVRAQFDANWQMSTPVVVYTATAPDNICNLGICASPFGFILSCETQQAARQVFFLKSTDLTAWSPVGSPISTGAYVGSPKIYYSARRNRFFLTLLRMIAGTDNIFYTTIARLPPSLGTFELFGGDTALVYPDGAGETFNASDVTMAEKDDKTYLVYLDGTQYGANYSNYRAAIFDGTMEQLWEQFFPTDAVAQQPPPAGVNLIPLMTGQTSSGVTVTASDTFQSSTFYAWKSADRDGTTFWHCNTTLAYPHYVRVDFSAAQTISSYAIKPRAGFPNQAPKNFTLKGLRVSDGVWVTVDTRTNQAYTDGAFNTFALASPVSYASFEIVIDNNVEGSVNLSIGELELRG